jgi:hypothetical protein
VQKRVFGSKREVKVKKKGKAVPLHAMEALGGRGDIPRGRK